MKIIIRFENKIFQTMHCNDCVSLQKFTCISYGDGGDTVSYQLSTLLIWNVERLMLLVVGGVLTPGTKESVQIEEDPGCLFGFLDKFLTWPFDFNHELIPPGDYLQIPKAG